MAAARPEGYTIRLMTIASPGAARREAIGAGTTRARVAVIKTRPETVLDDVAGMMRGLDYRRALPAGNRTVLKDNISWHLPYLSANTTPWQLEGVVKTLREDGYRDLLGLHNQTVVTDAHRGDKLNKFAGVYKRYGVPSVDNFDPECAWVRIEPKTPLLVLDRIFGEVRVPEVSVTTARISKPSPLSATRSMPSRWMVSMMPGKNGFCAGFSNDFASKNPWNKHKPIVA